MTQSSTPSLPLPNQADELVGLYSSCIPLKLDWRYLMTTLYRVSQKKRARKTADKYGAV